MLLVWAEEKWQIKAVKENKFIFLLLFLFQK